MAKRKKKKGGRVQIDLSAVIKAARTTLPHFILQALAREYRSYPRASEAGSAEQEFWVKVSKSTANLGSGMEKWVNEWQEEEEE